MKTPAKESKARGRGKLSPIRRLHRLTFHTETLFLRGIHLLIFYQIEKRQDRANLGHYLPGWKPNLYLCCCRIPLEKTVTVSRFKRYIIHIIIGSAQLFLLRNSTLQIFQEADRARNVIKN